MTKFNRKAEQDAQLITRELIENAERNRKAKKETVEKIDMTPTWESIAGVIELAFTNGTGDGRAIARLELQRMARVADRYVALDKAAKERRFETAEDAFRALADYEG